MNLSPKIVVQYLLPHHILSRLCGKLASYRVKWLKNFLIICFIKKYKVDLTEAVEENPYNYADFNSFFTRALKDGMRPLPAEMNTLVSPADGIISQIGKIRENSILQAKGFDYEVAAMLGDTTIAKEFINGAFATIYLAPSNYHRVHMPIGGTLKKMLYIPGKLFSVNRQTAETIPNLFSNNERVVAIFDTEVGKMAMILVGAMIVGGIETTWAGTINPHHEKELQVTDYSEQKIIFNRGDEMGRFKLGSTVILLFAEDSVKWHENLVTTQAVKMGMSLGCRLG